jgi:hypothetical protein
LARLLRVQPGELRETTRRIYVGDWREAEERNALVLRQLAEAGIGQ